MALIDQIKGTKLPLMHEQVITLQVYVEGEWQNAGTLTFPDANAGFEGGSRFTYLNDYIEAHIEFFGKTDEHSISENYPLTFEVWTSKQWPAFVRDIMPSGAARRWWKRHLGNPNYDERELDFLLLRNHTSSPIGHIRVLESVHEPVVPMPFTREEVIERDVGFLEYAASLGAALVGATGAGGDAPKILVVEDANGNIYPEGALPDELVAKSWLVKWPRGLDTPRDRLVLHTEWLYSRVLAECGFDIGAGEWFEPEHGKPSLWFPRFDRIKPDASGRMERLAVESFYSMAGIAEPGARVSHQTYLRHISNALEHRGQSIQMKEFVMEVISRDLLNMVLGNSDNHGRNSAVLRSGELAMAPIYDLAPMVMDPEGITRSTHWERWERGGVVGWQGVFQEVSEWIEVEQLESELRRFARSLQPLPDLLVQRGISNDVMRFPRIHLRDLDSKLTAWGLL